MAWQAVQIEILSLGGPFSAVPELLRRVREAGLKVAVASSAKTSELNVYLEIARVRDLVDVATSSEDTSNPSLPRTSSRSH
jgi:phosphoglycolate phosphatase-like HAD superfamily hydrolase